MNTPIGTSGGTPTPSYALPPLVRYTSFGSPNVHRTPRVELGFQVLDGEGEIENVDDGLREGARGSSASASNVLELWLSHEAPVTAILTAVLRTMLTEKVLS